MEYVAPPIDYNEVKGIDQKKSHALIHHFVVKTVDFLNKFSSICEQKLSEVERDIERLEITVTILEQKISSIPGMEIAPQPETSTSLSTNIDTTNPTVNGTQTQTQIQTTTQPQTSTQTTQNQPPPPPPTQELDLPPVNNGLTVEQDPEYAKYFKMLKIGVPMIQVQNKMRADGKDPSLLERPDDPAPTQAGSENSGSDSDDSFGENSDSNFSDSE